MLNFRLFLFFGLLSQAFALYTWTPDQIHEKARTQNLFVGYLGNDKTPNCSFQQDFKNQMEIASGKLSSENITVVWTDGSYKNGKHGSPIAVFYQVDYEPIPFNLNSDGNKMAHWVRKMLTIKNTYQLNTQTEYITYKRRHKTLFMAYLNSSDEIELYDMVSREFNVPFFYTKSEQFANEVLDISNQTIRAEHNWAGDKGNVELSMEQFRLTYGTDYLREFATNQTHHQVTEIDSYPGAFQAFSTNVENIAIVFAPTSELENEARKLGGVSSDLILSNRLIAYYAASDLAANRKLMDLLDVDTDKAVVLVLRQNELGENPFTMRCTQKTYKTLKDRKIYRGPNMIKLYEDDLKTWITKKH